MAISFVGATSAASGTSCTLPAHEAGDHLYIFAYRAVGDPVVPTLPAGWVSLGSNTTTGEAVRVGYKVAESNSESSGVWANANAVQPIVYRGGLGPGAVSTATGADSPAQAPALTMQRTDGSSWLLRQALRLSGTRITPPGYVTRATDLHDSGGGIAAAPAVDLTSANAPRWIGFTIELLDDAPTGLPVKQYIGGNWEQIGVLKAHNGTEWVKPKVWNGSAWA